ncbi:MAG: Fur family transcriptional regulator [Endomicrobiia bacterium]
MLKIFCFKKGHISVDDLYATVRMKYPNIGYATVHRTLKLFKKIGIAEEVKIDNQKALYEHKYKDDHHDHLVCIKCAKLIEISSEEIEYLQEKLAKKNNFKVLEHKLILYGVCKQCNKKI